MTGLQLGYESRCAKPHAFDVMLGSQLGVGSYRALVEEGLNGVMVSVIGQLQLHYVPFEKLPHPHEHRRFVKAGPAVGAAVNDDELGGPVHLLVPAVQFVRLVDGHLRILIAVQEQ